MIVNIYNLLFRSVRMCTKDNKHFSLGQLTLTLVFQMNKICNCIPPLAGLHHFTCMLGIK